MQILSEETLLPISLVILIAGGIVWLTKMFMISRDTDKHLVLLSARVDMLEKESSVVCERLARIETKLDMLIKNQG
mgnify:CR=1 FL=1